MMWKFWLRRTRRKSSADAHAQSQSSRTPSDACEESVTDTIPQDPLLAMCSVGASSVVLGFDSGILRHVSCEASQPTSIWHNTHAHTRSVSALCSTATSVDTINIIENEGTNTNESNNIQQNKSTGQVFSGSRDCSLASWDAHTGQLQWRRDEAHEMTVSAVAAHDQILASGSRDTSVKVWDSNQGTCIGQTRFARNIVTCMKFQCGKSDVLFQAGEDLQVRMLDVRASQAGEALSCVRSLVPFTYFALCIDTQTGSSGTQMVVTGTKGFDGVGCSVILWDIGTGKIIWEASGHQQDVVGCAFVNSGSAVVSVSKDGCVRLWDVTTGDCSDNVLVGSGYSDQAVGLSHVNSSAAGSLVSVATFGGGVIPVRCLAIGTLQVDARKSGTGPLVARSSIGNSIDATSITVAAS